MKPSWCDKLASTPTLGFRLTSHFAPQAILLNALSPILDRATETEAKNVTMDTSQPFGVTVNTHDGFQYSINESQVSVAFRHRAKLRPVSGGPPVMENAFETAAVHHLPVLDTDPEAEERAKQRAAKLEGWKILHPGTWRAPRTGQPSSKRRRSKSRRRR